MHFSDISGGSSFSGYAELLAGLDCAYAYFERTPLFQAPPDGTHPLFTFYLPGSFYFHPIIHTNTNCLDLYARKGTRQSKGPMNIDQVVAGNVGAERKLLKKTSLMKMN